MKGACLQVPCIIHMRALGWYHAEQLVRGDRRADAQLHALKSWRQAPLTCPTRPAIPQRPAAACRRPQPRPTAASAAMQQAAAAPAGAQAARTLLCTSLTAPTVDGMLAEAQEALAAGADIVELRIDFLAALNPGEDLLRLRQQCPLPAIVTYRPAWEA